jgi:hypothetical protein
MRIFLFLTLSLLLLSCSTVKVTKEVIKVTNTVTEQLKNSISKKEDINLEKIIDSKEIEEEIEIIEEKKQEEKKIVESQQKLAEINFIGKTEFNITDLLGQAQLSRVDGVVYTLRYDSKNCKLFLFFNLEEKNKRVDYFELRSTKAKLLNSKNSLEKCYREFKLIN